jgi:hypothetical protein
MKQSPDMQKLEEILRSSTLVADGFMGDDPRSISEVIEADAAELFRLGVTLDQLADRMNEITKKAAKGLGTWTRIDDVREAMIDEARGRMVCPWPHEARFRKQVTTVRRTDTDETVRWSDLNVHLIAAHGFFEGKGSAFRIDPTALVRVIF